MIPYVICGICVLISVFVLCLYKESKNNIIRLEKEKEDIEKENVSKLEEKDNKITELQTYNEELNKEVFNIKEKNEQEIINIQNKMDGIKKEMDIVNNKKKESDKEIEEYQSLIVELVNDMHELEEEYIKIGGNLKTIYKDYD